MPGRLILQQPEVLLLLALYGAVGLLGLIGWWVMRRVQ